VAERRYATSTTRPAKGGSARVEAVEVEQIERVEEKPALRLVSRAADGAEVWSAVLTGDHHLTIEHNAARRYVHGSLAEGRELLALVEAIVPSRGQSRSRFE
jgi:hypothetical protein